MRVLLILIALLTLSNQSKSQGIMWKLFQHKDSVMSRFDTTLIDPCLDQVTFRIYGVYRGNHLQNVNGGDATTVLSANAYHQIGLGFGYRWLILNTSVYTPMKNMYFDEKGETKKMDSQVNLYGRRVQLDGRLQLVKGYFLNDQSLWRNFFTAFEPSLFRSDIALMSIGAGANYTFNKNYIHGHGFNQMMLMKKSGHTWMTGAKINYLHIEGDSTIAYRKKDIGFKEQSSEELGVGGGYAYTHIYKKHWFFSIHAMFYLNGQMLKQDDYSYEVDFYPSAIFRTSFGYTNRAHFFGFYGVWDGSRHINQHQYGTDYFITNSKLIYAFRIPTKSFRKIFKR